MVREWPRSLASRSWQRLTPKVHRLLSRWARPDVGLQCGLEVETVTRDCAAGSGIGGEPARERLPQAPGDPPVTRLTWSAPGCPPVVLYRIEGGGHGWPGGPQYLSARVVGPISRHLDATGILLEQMTAHQNFLPPGCIR